MTQLHEVLPGVTMTERPLAAGVISEFRMFTQEALQVMLTYNFNCCKFLHDC